jgi:hypothetical protein
VHLLDPINSSQSLIKDGIMRGKLLVAASVLCAADAHFAAAATQNFQTFRFKEQIAAANAQHRTEGS